ncbi:MAG TPA: hypothetical protein EYP56_06305 [Planctomycetaceae bacterium]|nr:hypothetical protein [Planctomycetaceae bacterium]
MIRNTEAVVAEKDREIDELKQLLEEQSSNLGEVAIGAAAVGQILDQDEIIREHRERLRELQAEWEEKLRQAEVEISLERAKLARQRAEIEEQRRLLEEQHRRSGTNDRPETNRPKRGRWLAQLGLANGDDS